MNGDTPSLAVGHRSIMAQDASGCVFDGGYNAGTTTKAMSEMRRGVHPSKTLGPLLFKGLPCESMDRFAGAQGGPMPEMRTLLQSGRTAHLAAVPHRMTYDNRYGRLRERPSQATKLWRKR